VFLYVAVGALVVSIILGAVVAIVWLLSRKPGGEALDDA
jgi:hypothetical protein